MGGSESEDEVHARVPAPVGEESPSDDAVSEEMSGEEEREEDTDGIEKYVCVKQAQARAGVGMDSEKSSSIEVDEVVDVLQKIEIEDSTYGIPVTRLQTSRGWVSEKTAAGNVLFKTADADTLANAALRRAATLRARAAAYDSDSDDDDDPLSDSKDSGCVACCCSFLRNMLLLVVALILANFHYQFVDFSNLFMSAWYRVSATSTAGLLQPTVAPPPPETPEMTDPLFGADVFYPGLGRLVPTGSTVHVDT